MPTTAQSSKEPRSTPVARGLRRFLCDLVTLRPVRQFWGSRAGVGGPRVRTRVRTRVWKSHRFMEAGWNPTLLSVKPLMQLHHPCGRRSARRPTDRIALRRVIRNQRFMRVCTGCISPLGGSNALPQWSLHCWASIQQREPSGLLCCQPCWRAAPASSPATAACDVVSDRERTARRESSDFGERDRRGRTTSASAS